MRPRHRLGAALLIDPPVATEVEGLRRALGDSSLGAVAAHLTLVPPVNVPTDALDEAVDVLRHAAYGQRRPLELVLGPPATFFPASPVVYLAVAGAGGDDLANLGRLHQAMRAGPLERPERWPWVPHVTLSDEAPTGRINAAVEALASYTATVVLDRVVLLEETDRRWAPIADACFGPPAVVGRGGLELEITQGRVFGPDAVAMAEGAGVTAAALAAALSAIVLTGRRAGRVVGLAAASAPRRVGAAAHAFVLVEPPSRGQGVGRALLMALEARVAAAGWAATEVLGHGPPGFYAHCGDWARGAGPDD